MKINDKFKAKAKMFMLKAALTASVSAGVSGAAAQNIQNNDKHSNNVEQTHRDGRSAHCRRKTD